MVLSTLHQSSLGALFLMAPTKLHPLWYSTYIPVFFFISSLCAGISMVIVESGLSHRVFQHRVDSTRTWTSTALTLGLAQGRRGGAVRLLLPEAAGPGRRRPLGRCSTTPYGLWFLVEVLGFVLLPSLLFAYGARAGKVRLVRWRRRLDGARRRRQPPQRLDHRR